MSRLRQPVTSQSWTILTRKTKRVMTLNAPNRAKAVRAVRVVAAAVVEAVVEAAKNPLHPFVRKNAQPPAPDVRCVMKTTWMMTMIWQTTMSNCQISVIRMKK